MHFKKIHELFDERVAEDLKHPFLFLADGGVVTMGELSSMVDALEMELRQSDVRLGDRVLVVAENCPEHIALVLACSRVGAWAAGVNARMTASEVAAFDKKSDSRVVYFTSQISSSAKAHAQNYSATSSVLPAMFTRLLAAHPASATFAPHLRYVYTGAAPLDMTLKRALEACFGLPLHHGYGLSEYAGVLAVCRLNEARDDTSAGYLVEGAELRIVNLDGLDLPIGETGEIWMRGVGLMPGYFRDPENTAKVINQDGWYASGDLGRQDADGALYVVGRLKEMIIRSGFNVYPVEIEAVLMTYTGVLRAAVVGRREQDGNEEILAFIEPKAGAVIDTSALLAHASAHLAPYKRPALVTLVAEMPMTLSGKVLKRELLKADTLTLQA
jgi:acyl-CoA synthetase (AMP-forming)/AMP-acid ligase II